MKKTFLLSLLASYAMATNVGVSILPQENIVKELLPSANVITLMPEGADPHTYEPKPKQMLELSKAKVFLAIGVEVEDIWLKKLAENTNIKIANIDNGIKKQHYTNVELDHHGHHHDDHHDHHHHHHDDHHHDDHHDHHGHHHHHHDHNSLDVHIWTSPKNLEILAKNTAKELAMIEPSKKDEINKNLKNYLAKISKVDKSIQKNTKNLKTKGFISSHPSWGYFAKNYDLIEYSLELEGKEIKPKELAKIINVAKDKKACLILKAPQFNDKLAKTIEKESGLKIVSINPLARDILKEIENFAKIINNNCSK